jgi:two-component system sensor histidine kinase and response regulator WspE
MNPHFHKQPGGPSMLELFRAEVENQTAILTHALMELERGDSRAFQTLMRAAHSLKGAARIVNHQLAVRVAHALEDCFVTAQQHPCKFGQPEFDVLFRGIDLLSQLAKGTNTGAEARQAETEVEGLLHSFSRLSEHLLARGAEVEPPGTIAGAALMPGVAQAPMKPALSPEHVLETWEVPPATVVQAGSQPPERVVRLAAENLNRLLALAGESLVESRWLRPFADSFQTLKRHQADLGNQLGQIRAELEGERLSDRTRSYLNELSRQLLEGQQFLADRVQELDMFDRRASQLAQRLYLEVLRTRMRPFSDGARRFPRMVRDLARSMGKNVNLHVTGEATQVDREILERLEAPLAHLLRNAVDHGCESPATRAHAGKPAECELHLEARHSAGVLLVTVADDGAGVDLEQVRQAAICKRLISPIQAEKLGESDLLEFLLLPGFTLKETVSEISGRGFGLDVVQNMVKGVRGTIRLQNQPGRGLRVQLQLPLTLSVVRALLVEVAGEPYAIPLSQITRTLRVPRHSVQTLEGRPQVLVDNEQVGLLTANQVLECGQLAPTGEELSVVVLSDRTHRYGVVVDRFLGERELVVQPLDSRLGRLQDIAAAALMEDGTPVLIINVEDMLRSIDRLVMEGRLTGLEPTANGEKRPKRVLAVDDSLTVRELERKLLSSHGYITDIAVDGLDAWNALQSGDYDLVITDVEMPRLGGIELAARIKQDPRLQSVPVLIVSYKEAESEQLRGLQAGADYYITKGTFQDADLLQAVADLIGEATT